jgi:AcrR family transcriptional regulator
MRAMLELVSRQGYEASTVSEVISLIGMSRKTFYEQFDDRRSCFIWVCEQIGSQWLDEARRVVEETPEGEPATVALLNVLFERAIEQPGALRTVMLEAAVVRPGGPELRDRTIEQWAGLLAQTLHEDASGTQLGPELSAAIFGGIVRTLNAGLPPGVRPRAPRRRQLMDLVPQLARWAACYVDHPPRERPPARGEAEVPPLLFGGRAPGTLAIRSRFSERRGLPRGENPISRSFVVHSQRERILDAVANLVADKGYADLTIPDIVQEAAVSVQAFYEHFSSKEDAFMVAYEVGHRRALVAFERAFESQQDWPNQIQAGLRALYSFFAAEPSFAYCALVEAPSASERTATLLSQGIGGYLPMFNAGFEEAGAKDTAPEISAEAIVQALHELCFSHIAKGKAGDLAHLVPEAAFIALAPFIGGEAATEIAAPGSAAAATQNGRPENGTAENGVAKNGTGAKNGAAAKAGAGRKPATARKPASAKTPAAAKAPAPARRRKPQ